MGMKELSICQFYNLINLQTFYNHATTLIKIFINNIISPIISEYHLILIFSNDFIKIKNNIVKMGNSKSPINYIATKIFIIHQESKT